MLLLLSKDNCGHCEILEQLLRENGIYYEKWKAKSFPILIDTEKISINQGLHSIVENLGLEM